MSDSDIFFHKIKSIPIKNIEIWDDVEARLLEEEGVSELAESIRKEGLQNPPIVQKGDKGKYKLIAGQRRLAALKKIGVQNSPVLVVQRPYEESDARAVSIIENLHRKQMSTKEMTDACNYLVDSMGSKKKAASALGISQSTLRNYLGFKGVPEQLKDLVPKTISRGEAIRITRLTPSISEGIEIANRISRYSTKARRRYLDALEEDPKAEHSVLKRMANYYKQKQKMGLREIPQATQIFTPRWIVQYLVENTLGRLWLRMHPNSKLASKMKYFVPNPYNDKVLIPSIIF